MTDLGASARLGTIAAHYGVRVRGGGIRIPCPAHGGRDPNLALWEDGDRLGAHCYSHGCSREAINGALIAEAGIGLYAQREAQRAPRVAPPAPRESDVRAQRDAAQAQADARRMMEVAAVEPHPYLARKGFEDARGLVLPDGYRDRFGRDQGGMLVLPMVDARTSVLRSAQLIAPDGSKRFLPGGVTAEAVYRIGPSSPRRRWFVEGYATGLSVYMARTSAYQSADAVVVCFSSGTLRKVARNGYVIADHDWWRCGAKGCDARWDAPAKACPACGHAQVVMPEGERAARETQLPYWMPPEPGTDANDYAVRYGIERLRDELGHLVRREVIERDRLQRTRAG